MSFPVFASGDVLNASDMNAVGLWRVTSCTVTSVGGTAATASNGVITVGTNNTSITVNNAFSNDYDNYKIIISGVDCSTFGSQCSITFNNTTTNDYRWAANWRSVTNVFGGDGQNGVSNIWVSLSGDSNDTNVSIEVMNPNKSVRTTCTSQFGGADYAGTAGGVDMTTAQHTGFTFIAPSGQTFTGGVIRVYGYRN